MPAQVAPILVSERGGHQGWAMVGYGLTPREKAVCGLLAEGKDHNYIGKALDISASTVSTHVQKVYAKCGVHAQTELVLLVHGHMQRPAPLKPVLDRVPLVPYRIDLTGEQLADIAELYVDGASLVGLAAKYHCGEQVIRKGLVECGVTIRPPGKPSATIHDDGQVAHQVPSGIRGIATPKEPHGAPPAPSAPSTPVVGARPDAAASSRSASGQISRST